MKLAIKNRKFAASALVSKKSSGLSLRIGDQETARVVAVHGENGQIVGAGCLLDAKHILTCRHVVTAALRLRKLTKGVRVAVSLAGVASKPTVYARLSDWKNGGPENDIALLEILASPLRNVEPVEFASPLRHAGKTYSVLGFPGGDPQGRNATGRLHASDAKELVQMDRGGALSVLGGFSGAPVWSPDVNAFVGMVVTELSNDDVSWCIPSRLLCQFYPELPVRFRIPPIDRPVIHDRTEDDPNVQMFGNVSNNGQRKLKGRAIWNEVGQYYDVKVTYKRISGSPPLRGKYVTFITYPDFLEEGTDAYELFSKIEADKARTRIYPEDDLFAIAAIGDGGDTALTLDLFEVEK
jgi:hypothetical protein